MLRSDTGEEASFYIYVGVCYDRMSVGILEPLWLAFSEG